MATPPTRVARLASVFNTTSGPKTAGPFTCLAGDLLVVKAINENGETFNTPTGGTGLTYTSRVNVATGGSNGRVSIWTAPVGSGQSVTVSVNQSTSNDQYGIEVTQWRDHGGVGQVWSGQIASGSGTPSVTATATGANSAIDMAVTDWNVVATTGKTYRTADAGSFTENTATQVASHYTYYLGYYADSSSQASKTVGLSAPSGMRWVLGAVEVLGSASGSQTLTPSSISPGTSVSAPTLAPGAVTITPDSVAAGSQVFAAALAQIITPGLVSSSISIVAPTLTPGAVTIQPTFLGSAEQVFTPSTGGQAAVTPNMIAAGSALFTPSLAVGGVTVTPGTITAAAQLFTPALLGGDLPAVPLRVPSIPTVPTVPSLTR